MTTLDTGVTVTTSKIPLLMEEAGNWITWKTRIEAKLASIDARNIILGKESCLLPHTSNPDLTPAENQTAALPVLDKQSDWDKHDAKPSISLLRTSMIVISPYLRIPPLTPHHDWLMNGSSQNTPTLYLE